MFASITNPPARMQLERWERLVKKYANKDVQLFVIYGRELHPGDKKEFKAYPAPKSEYEKMAYAQEFAQLAEARCLARGRAQPVVALHARAILFPGQHARDPRRAA